MGSVGDFKRQLKKELTRCEVADEPVVVKKSRPEKPGNRVEEKTATTSDLVQAGDRSPKASIVAKGGSFKEVFSRRRVRQCAAQVKVVPSGTIPSGTP